MSQTTPWTLIKHRITGDPTAAEGQHFTIEAEFEVGGKRRTLTGSGDGAISAFVDCLGIPARIMDYHEHAIGTGTDTRAACYTEVRIADAPTGFGVGVDRDIVTASFKAVLSALNRYIKAHGAPVTTSKVADSVTA